MKQEKQYYYSLRLTGDTPYYRSGDLFRGASEPLLIGETADCDVRYGPTGGYAPEQYAAILPDSGGRSWRLVPLSPYVEVSVSGVGQVKTVCRLSSGDRISFAGQKATLTFREHHDEAFRDTGRIIVSRPDNRVVYGLFAFLAVALVVIGAGLFFAMKGIKKSDLVAEEASTFVIRVDSVDCLMRVAGRPDSLLWCETFADGHNPAGTAFLTADSLLVTARHCVEPWVGDDSYIEDGLSHLAPDNLLRRVAEASTWNYLRGERPDTLLLLRSHCSVADSAGLVRFAFNSLADSVIIDRSREHIVTIDDFDNIYYMPSLVSMFNDRSMERGDIVAVRTHTPGTIHLAAADVMTDLSSSPEIGLLGYPENGYDRRELDFSAGNVQGGMTRRGSGMIALKVQATHGFSGGPVFIKSGTGYVAVGVLSKVDHVNSDIKYAVPVNELPRKKP